MAAPESAKFANTGYDADPPKTSLVSTCITIRKFIKIKNQHIKKKRNEHSSHAYRQTDGQIISTVIKRDGYCLFVCLCMNHENSMYSIYLLWSWQLSLDSCEFLLSKLIIAYSLIYQAKSSRSASFLVNISTENWSKQCTFPHLHYNRTLDATPC